MKAHGVANLMPCNISGGLNGPSSGAVRARRFAGLGLHLLPRFRRLDEILARREGPLHVLDRRLERRELHEVAVDEELPENVLLPRVDRKRRAHLDEELLGRALGRLEREAILDVLAENVRDLGGELAVELLLDELAREERLELAVGDLVGRKRRNDLFLYAAPLPENEKRRRGRRDAARRR